MSATIIPTVHVTARIPATLKADLDAIVKSTGRNRNELIQEALRRFVEAQRWQIARIEEGLRTADAGDFASEQEMAELWAEFGLEADASQEDAH